eukprot:gnl/TRDRNA2_/TRDRNA2_175651_c2_seq2.p1 gnl/TRDRNA2_/TRDRNA2_175651_c2~~gnl/TRDRNA2_/TRDRNA2_175651_c2_seq2.p1  ORF type:complete len:316 (+),score=59.08 gnl/TRDRNA2_/TRDRNA2_175651_c2_seq2:1-948(+)
MKPLDIGRFASEYFSGALVEQKRLVLIASNAGNVQTLKEAVRSFGDQGAPIITMMYDYDWAPAQLVDLVKDLVKRHGTFKTVCMVCHSGSEEAAELRRTAIDTKVDTQTDDQQLDKWMLFKSHGVDLQTGTSDEGIDDIFQTIADAASVRVDILACSLVETPQGREWVKQWEERTKKNFAASNDVTSNPEYGGNWVLESDGINVAKVYFDEKKIAEWEGALGINKEWAKARREERRARGEKRGGWRKSDGSDGGRHDAVSSEGGGRDWEAEAQQVRPPTLPNIGFAEEEGGETWEDRKKKEMERQSRKAKAWLET